LRFQSGYFSEAENRWRMMRDLSRKKLNLSPSEKQALERDDV